MRIDLSGLNEGQRRIASTLDAPLFVEAGAGSGKTFTLTQRIAWALSPGSGSGGDAYLEGLDQVLVITFTEAAAREIKERVRSTLLAAGMREAALSVDAAWIGTIHGMCDRIVRRHALDLGVDPGYSIAQQSVAEPLLEQAIDLEVGAAMRARAGDGRLAALFGAFAYAGVERRVRALLDVSVRLGGLSQLAFPGGGALPAAMGRLLAACEAIGGAPGLTKAASAAMGPTLDALRDFDRLAPGERDAAHALAALGSCALPRSSKAIAELLPDARLALAHAQALASLEQARELAPALVELSERTSRRYGQAKRDASLLDYDDLVALALAAVEGNARVAASYARRFRLVMVDEFQDTDARQLRLISLLSGDGATRLATVGDAQQSIYGFRGADVGVFESRGAGLPPELRVRLDTNYRSHKDILDFVERVCGGGTLRSFMHLDHNPNRADGYVAHGMPRVHVEVASGPSASGHPSKAQTAVLACQVADRMAAYRDAGQRAGDMALLLGVTTNAGLYIDALRARGLECVVTGGSTFTSAPEVGVVRALLHALANPGDTQTGLFPLLSSELFGLDADDFVQLGTRAQTVLEAPTKRGIDVGLASLELYGGVTPSLRLRRASEVMGRALASVGAVPVADLCLQVIRASGWLSRLEAQGADGAAREANVLAAVRHVRSLTEELGLGPARAAEEFDRWLAISKVPPASLAGAEVDAVRVMTVHASKGLEFPVVAVAECWGNAEAGSGVLAGVAPDGSPTALVCPSQRVTTDMLEPAGRPGDLAEWHAFLRERALADGDEEKARLLYVGLTRAREALVLALGCPTTNAGISSRLAERVVGALFDGELPRAGISSVAYGDGSEAVVRHVRVGKEDGAYVADTAGCLPEIEGTLPPDPAELCGAAEGDACVGAGFSLYELPGAPEFVRIEAARPREGVFSYSSAHEEAARVSGGPSPAAPRTHAPRRAERDAEADGAPVADDQDKATSLGSAFHELAQALVESGRPLDPSRVDETGRFWHLSQRQRARLDEALARWQRSDLRREALSYEVVCPEAPFFLEVRGAPYGEYVEGAIDLLCRDRGCSHALVVDYKTGDVGLSVAEISARHEMQANFYAHVLMSRGFGRVGCAFACVEVDDGHGQPVVVRYDFDAARPPRPW